MVSVKGSVGWIVGCSVLIVGSVLSVFVAYASPALQGGQPLQIGEPVTGTLDDDTFRQVYTFLGQAQDVIAVSLARTSGDLDPYLLLTDEQGTILAVSDDHGSGVDALISFKSLPASGRYFVIATRFGQEHGKTAGEYELLLNLIGTGMTEDTVLTYGDSVLGRVSHAQPLVFYFLRAERGDFINVSLRRISGDLDPRVDIATTGGLVLISNDDDPNAEGTLDAGIANYLIEESGVYLIVATRFGDSAGDTEGGFVLSVDMTPSELLGDSLDTARLIDYGMTLNGEINDDVPVRYFRFEARRGDVITATLSTAAGNLDPMLRLVDADQDELAQDDNSGGRQNARIAAFTMPRTGVYYLLATRFREAEGQTRGEFSLELNGRAGVVGGRALEIVYGASVSGQLDGTRVAEEYVFFGHQGDVITISMERVSGNLDSLLTLYDSDRKQVAFDDDSGGDQNSSIERFVLPRDDMYILVASRYDRETGTTNGAYILSLELVRSGN
jgi:hypothetical protein